MVSYKRLTCLLFRELSMPCNMVPKIATIHEVNDKVYVLPILEGVVHVNQEPSMGEL